MIRFGVFLTYAVRQELSCTVLGGLVKTIDVHLVAEHTMISLIEVFYKIEGVSFEATALPTLLRKLPIDF